MKVEIEFEKLKEAILLIAEKQGITSNHLLDNWSIDYTLDQDHEFEYLSNNINEEIKLLHQSIKSEDMLTVICSIIRIKAFTHNLRDLLDNIKDDIENLMWSEELKNKWPKIPEDYKVPEHYDYEDTNKPYEKKVVFKSEI